MSETSIAFTREGAFYSRHMRRTSAIVGRVYRFILGLLLVCFFMFRLRVDWPTEVPALGQGLQPLIDGCLVWLRQHFLFLVDIAVGIPTPILIRSYASPSRT